MSAEPPGRGLAEDVCALRIENQDRVVPLPPAPGQFVVGTAPSCDLVLDDPYTSGHHCALVRHGETLRVRDLDSTNGTYVDGVRIDTAVLSPGHRLCVGRTTLVALAAAPPATTDPREAIRGRDPALLACIETAVRAGRAGCDVLLLGETGTGKELFARLVHHESPRWRHPFVAINCGAISRTLVASELFGHVRGAFTGASEARDGVFVEAGRGTLFLDEIGELPKDMQPTLLRVLETRRVRRVGSNDEVPAPCGVVAATLAPEESLRRDLFHRLSTVVIRIPPLRERRADIPLLVRGFLAELAPMHGRREIAPAVVHRLMHYPWPGNIRELRQAVHRAVALGGRRLEYCDFLPVDQQTAARRRCESARKPAREEVARADGTVEKVMEDLVRDALERYGSFRRAAKALGMSKSTFADRARRYGLKSPRARG